MSIAHRRLSRSRRHALRLLVLSSIILLCSLSRLPACCSPGAAAAATAPAEEEKEATVGHGWLVSRGQPLNPAAACAPAANAVGQASTALSHSNTACEQSAADGQSGQQ